MKDIYSPRARLLVSVFLLLHLFAYLALIIIPARAATGNIAFLVLINSLFLGTVLLVSTIVYKVLSFRSRVNKSRPMSLQQLKWNVWFIFVGTLSGFLAILFDRVVVRGINYSAGLRAARYQWLDSQGGNLWGVAGNILIPLGYVALYFIVIHYRRLKFSSRILLVASAALGIFGHAALNGGRSNVLLAATIAMIAHCIGVRDLGRSKTRLATKVNALIATVVGVVYIAYIIQSSASMGNANVKQLAASGIQDLYGQVTSSFDIFGDWFGEYVYFLIYILTYLYHGQWTAQIAGSLPDRIGSYTFYVYEVVLQRFGLIQTVEGGHFSKIGAFISLPGAFFYDYGFFGLIIMSVLFGSLFGMVLFSVRSGNSLGGSSVGFILLVVSTLFLSPTVPAYGLISLNFAVFTFVWLDVLNVIIFRTRTDWASGLPQARYDQTIRWDGS